METKLATLAALLLGLIALSPNAIAQTVGCAGCVDGTATPTPPSPDQHWVLGDLRGTATYFIEITNASGICELKAVELPGGGTAIACDDTLPCTTRVHTWVDLDGDILGTTEGWDISANGSYGWSSQNTFTASATNDATVQLFDSPVRVGCGEDLSSDVTYSIHFYTFNLFGGKVTEATFLATFSFDFDCSACGALHQL